MMDFVDRYVAEVRTAGVAAGETARAYLERILARLDAIHLAVQSEEWQERHFTLVHTQDDDEEQEFLDISPGREFMLTHAAILGSGALTVNQGGEVRYTKQFDAADTAGPLEIVLHGGGQITAIVETPDPDPIRVMLTFKERIRKPRRSPGGAGRPELSADTRDAGGRQDTEGRHSVG